MKLFKYANNYKFELSLAIILIFISVIIGIFPYFVTNDLILAFIGEGVVLKSQVLHWSLLIALFLILKGIIYSIGLTFSHKAAFGTLYEMRKTFSEKLEKMPLGVVQEKGSGYYKKKIVDDIGALEVNFAHMFVEGIPNIVVPIIVLIIIFITDWRLGLLSLASIPISVFAMTRMMKSGMKLMEGYYNAQNKLNSTIIEYISGMEVIKIFGQTSASYKKYAKDVENYKNYTLDWISSCWLPMSVIGFLLPSTLVLSLPIGALMCANGLLTLDTFIFVLLLDTAIGVPLNRALMFLPYIPNTNYAVKELEKIFLGEPLKNGGNTTLPNSYDICFENVRFAYDQKEVINGINLKMKEGTLNAIVGPSGGGKSTLAKLLVHYWDVKEGTIKIGGKDIREYSRATLMDMISFVNQDNFLFNDTIWENIKIGNKNASDEEIINAAKAAACDGFINELTEGYNTNVGVDGGKLSGGERQRITIARAILKDSPIIILDEATSSTDVENEDLIQEAMNNLMTKKTIIVIAHRLRSIIEADKIFLMNYGELEAVGKHDELLNDSDLYAKLWEANEKAFEWKLEVQR